MIQAENWENSRGTEVDVVKSRWADSAVRGNTVPYITTSRRTIQYLQYLQYTINLMDPCLSPVQTLYSFMPSLASRHSNLARV